MEDYSVDQSYHQMLEQILQHDTDEKGVNFQCNHVKSEQSLVVTSAKRVAVFQAILKLVREEAGAQLCNKSKYMSIGYVLIWNTL